MQKLLCVIHELTNNGATKVCLDTACALQSVFDVFIVAWTDGTMISNYTFRNEPIVIGSRPFEHDLPKYLDRVETACSIIRSLSPDVIYIHCSVCNDFFHAALISGTPVLYHHHEGKMGYKSELDGCQIPTKFFFRTFVSRFDSQMFQLYSASPITTQSLEEIFEVNSANVKERLYVEFDSVLRNASTKCETHGPFLEKKKDRLLVGACGDNTFRKGFDLFLACATACQHLDFCWVGGSIDSVFCVGKELPSNVIFIPETTNPHCFINQFDVFVSVSREEGCPLVVLESLFLQIPTYISTSISAWENLAAFGANVLPFESSMDNWLSFFSTLTNRSQLRQPPPDNRSRILKRFSCQLGEIEKELIRLAACKKRFDAEPKKEQSIEAIIESHHENPFDLSIYRNKYLDLAELPSEQHLIEHWEKIGKYRRTCIQNDWKLYLSLCPSSTIDKGIFTKEELSTDSFEDIVVHFDSHVYWDKYEDLQRAFPEKSMDDLTAHFMNHGIHEGREGFVQFQN